MPGLGHAISSGQKRVLGVAAFFLFALPAGLRIGCEAWAIPAALCAASVIGAIVCYSRDKRMQTDINPRPRAQPTAHAKSDSLSVMRDEEIWHPPTSYSEGE